MAASASQASVGAARGSVHAGQDFGVQEIKGLGVDLREVLRIWADNSVA